MRDTKQVKDRRNVKFASVDEILADAEALHRDGYEQLGNWTLGQNCEHLGIAMQMCVKGFPMKAPLWIRVMRPLIRRSIAKNGMPQGIPLKGDLEALVPKCQSDEEGLAIMREAMALMKSTDTRHPSPVIGPLDVAGWDRFHCQHAELHLGYLKPKQG